MEINPFIEKLKEKKYKAIAGNKEYFEELYWKEEGILNRGGDTMLNEVEFENYISEESAAQKLKSYYIDKCHTFNMQRPQNDDEWREFLKEEWHI